MKRVFFLFGTRPEAIKLGPVIRAVRAHVRLEAVVCVTAQHRDMLDQALDCFDIRPDYDLDLMTPGQTLAEITARVLSAVDPLLTADPPALVVVQGDTTTTMAGALAAFYRGIPIAHVEAGLRTGNLGHPFPEELNRVVTARMASLHFAPTEQARRNLLAESAPAERIHVTGNPGIDAVLHVAGQLGQGSLMPGNWPWLDPTKHLILVTAHRRETFGAGIANICSALVRIADRGDAQIAYPVHRNPNILEPVMQRLAGKERIVLLEPLNYRLMVDLIRRARFLLTDSGGLQEEAPSLGKPVLVLRDTTERPEAVEAGTVKLVGTDPLRIVTETERLLTDDEECGRMSRIHNPYGDGRAADRIARITAEFLSAVTERPGTATSPSPCGR